jgi:hypothetical protein
MRSKAKTADAYIDELPVDRAKVVKEVRAVIHKNLPKGYCEAMNWGMICYEVPLERFSKTYNDQPLCYLSLAAQKNYFTLHVTCAYGSEKIHQAIETAFKRAGKKLDMGKGCIRFKGVDDIPLRELGKIIGSVPLETFVKHYESAKKKR